MAASGRSMQSLKLVFEDFVDEIGFVAENGSIVEYQGQTIFMDDPISPEIYLPIIAGIDAGPLVAVVPWCCLDSKTFIY